MQIVIECISKKAYVVLYPTLALVFWSLPSKQFLSFVIPCLLLYAFKNIILRRSSQASSDCSGFLGLRVKNPAVDSLHLGAQTTGQRWLGFCPPGTPSGAFVSTGGREPRLWPSHLQTSFLLHLVDFVSPLSWAGYCYQLWGFSLG